MSERRRHAAERRAWHNMHRRCSDPEHRSFAYYGGRGIQVCERWSSFEAFLADMGPRPSAVHSLDRIDGDKGYEPGNCRWATAMEQSANRRGLHMVTYQGREMHLSEAARLAGLPVNVVFGRLWQGWTEERALSQPMPRNGAGHTTKHWVQWGRKVKPVPLTVACRYEQVSYATVLSYIRKGLDPQAALRKAVDRRDGRTDRK